MQDIVVDVATVQSIGAGDGKGTAEYVKFRWRPTTLDSCTIYYWPILKLDDSSDVSFGAAPFLYI